MNILYLRALDSVHYKIDPEWTMETNLKNCFAEFTGNKLSRWIKDIPLDDMAKALLRVA